MADTKVSLKILIDTKKGMVGCLGNLYDSIENLSQTYILPNQDKDSLLKPNAPALSQGPLLLTSDAQVPTSSKKFYICSAVIESSSDEGGFVRGVVTYMVMDDLVVKPMSTISSITLLNKFNVKEVGFEAAEGITAVQGSLNWPLPWEDRGLIKHSIENDSLDFESFWGTDDGFCFTPPYFDSVD
ncbi:hypothetical protein CK203_010334 [Vitis vinifera]|uniref:Uncharacterized protein n=1 Tax=Vitis vinifera TaxID=29760 RepID=A0A438JXV5_VITVI|nr:hypothetical protein CK203_010334 [Vitis vinifera]